MATWSAPQTFSRHKGHQPELEHLFDGGAEDVSTDDHRLHTSMRAPLLGINVIEVEGSTRYAASDVRIRVLPLPRSLLAAPRVVLHQAMGKSSHPL